MAPNFTFLFVFTTFLYYFFATLQGSNTVLCSFYAAVPWLTGLTSFSLGTFDILLGIYYSPSRHTVAIWTFKFHKISRHCVVDFEGQFQTSLQDKSINFLIWKFKFFILVKLRMRSVQTDSENFFSSLFVILVYRWLSVRVRQPYTKGQ